jgi:uncharacterized repeat protein (TIGR02543 family)
LSSISIDSTTATAGSTVGIHVSASEGNYLPAGGLTVVGDGGETVTVNSIVDQNLYRFTMPSDSVTVSAQFQPIPINAFSISFDPGSEGFFQVGADAVDRNIQTASNLTGTQNVLSLSPASPIFRAGYSFLGWSQSGTLPAITPDETSAADVTYKAIWAPVDNWIAPFYIKFDINGGYFDLGGGHTDRSIQVSPMFRSSHGVIACQPDITVAKRTGFLFSGWSLNGNLPAITAEETSTANVTYKAIWRPVIPTFIEFPVEQHLEITKSLQIRASIKDATNHLIVLSNLVGSLHFTYTANGSEVELCTAPLTSGFASCANFTPNFLGSVIFRAAYAGDSLGLVNSTAAYLATSTDVSSNIELPTPPPSGGGTTVVIQQTTAPTVTWAPGSMVEGDQVGAKQLNAVASVPGTFSYSVAPGFKPQAGELKVVATFNPTNTSLYSQVVTTLNIPVAPAVLPTPTPTPTPSNSPSPTPTASSRPTPTPQPTVTALATPIAKPTPTPKPTPVKTETALPGPVTLADVKGAINISMDPTGTAINVTLSSFPVKTSSISKLQVVATDMSTGKQITVPLPSKTVGTSVKIKGTVPGDKYSVALVYISTTGVQKKLKSAGFVMPAKNPSITAPIKTTSGKESPNSSASSNSATVQLQNTKKNQRVRVFIGKSDR